MLFKWKHGSTPEESPEEKIRSRTEKIAYQLYQNRLTLQKVGDEESDWEMAQRIVQEPVKLALFACHTSLIQLEKRVWEPLLAWADNQALLRLLGLVGNVGIIIATLTYIGSEKQRRESEVLNAWQTITNTHGQAGSGGRIQALEFLNASPGANWRRKFPWFCAPMSLCVWPAESLAGINLIVDSPEKAAEENNDDSAVMNETGTDADGVYLVGIQLPNAKLGSAKFGDANLWYANFEDAYLAFAILEGAYLGATNFKGANLWNANLKNANLWNANFEDAYLAEANFKGTTPVGANLKGADLTKANFEGALLVIADLEGANLKETNLLGADLEDANVEGVEQVTQAKLCFTRLPPNIRLSPNRDCAELGYDPETGKRINQPESN